MIIIRLVRFNRIILLSLVGIIYILCLSGCTNSASTGQSMYSAPKRSRLDYEIQADRAPTAKTLYIKDKCEQDK